MLTFLTYLWHQTGVKERYQPEHVRRWARMIGRHYAGAHRCMVVTDVPGDYGADLIVTEPGGAWSDLPNPEGRTFPSCYRRLEIWSREARERFGERLVMMDLDCTVLGDLAPLVDRLEPVVLLRDAIFHRQYNGGMVMLTAGARPEVWERFRGQTSIVAARQLGYRGSDQAWISHVLGPRMPVWTSADGVHSWKRDLRHGLPRPDSRLVMFHGRDKPWHDRVPAIYH